MSPANFFFIVLVNFFAIISATLFYDKNFPKLPAILIFGDSTVDTGNNKYLIDTQTIAEADHHPYGMNFPGQIPTGRFSDGKLVPDFLISMLGLKETIPPFLQPNLTEHEILTGLCFASAASGYDPLTSKITGAIPMLKQLDYFQDYINRLTSIVGDQKARRIIRDALIIIGAGTNDFVFNYYDIPSRRFKMNIDQYQDFVLQNLQDFSKKLYNLGGRTLLFTGLPPIGCVPIQRTVKSPFSRNCSGKENSNVQSYNNKLEHILTSVQSSLPGSKIIYADIYSPLIDMVNNSSRYGFVETKKGCCGTGKVEMAILCNNHSDVCSNPSEYMFFDAVHPTEAAYKHLTYAIVKQILPRLRDKHFI